MAWERLGVGKIATELGTAGNGTNTGVTLDTSDKKLGAASYDYAGSTSSYTTLGTAAQWNFMSNATANKWSLTFWLKYEDTISGGGHTILSTTDGSTQNDGFFIDNASGALRLIQVDGDDGSWSGAITDANWHHYAFTWNAGTVTLYVDGVSKGTQACTAGSGTPQYPIKLAINNDEYPIDCKFDDLGIWKRVLTATEIADLVNAPDSWWVGGSSKNVTIDGNTVTTTGSGDWANWVHGKAVTSGTLEFTVDDTSTNVFVGFGTGTGTDSLAAGAPVKNCVYLTAGGDIYWSDSTGTDNDTGSNRASGDTYKLVWQSNGNLDLYVKASGGSYGSSLKAWTGVTGTLYPMVQGYGGIVVTMLPTETIDGALVSSLADTDGLVAHYEMNTNDSNVAVNSAAVPSGENAVGDTITVDSLTAKKYLSVVIHAVDSGAIMPTMRFNNDSGSNYANRYDSDEAAETTQASQTSIQLDAISGSMNELLVLNIINISDSEKLCITHGYVGENAAGSGSIPRRNEGVSKWANTSNAITRIDILNGGGDFAVGTEVTVFGTD